MGFKASGLGRDEIVKVNQERMNCILDKGYSKNSKNYMRYRVTNEKLYTQHTLSYFLMRKPCDEIIIPRIKQISECDILEVGAGYGYYTSMILDKNNVEVADVNPTLCQHIGCPVYACNATELNDIIKKRYDYILSFWMTEYLNEEDMRVFLRSAFAILNRGGTLSQL